MVKFQGVKEFKVKADYIEAKLLASSGTVLTMNIDLREHAGLREDADLLAQKIMNIVVKILEA